MESRWFSQRCVLPSMSDNRKVTVPLGNGAAWSAFFCSVLRGSGISLECSAVQLCGPSPILLKAGATTCLGILEKNGALAVTWVHSYVTKDRKKSYCIYDGPSEDALRQAAQHNGLPVDSVSEVSVLDPYFYH